MKAPGGRTPPPSTLAKGESPLATHRTRPWGRIVAVAGLQIAGLAMVVGGITVMSGASQEAEADRARAEEVLVEARADRDAASLAERRLDSLPSADQVRKNGEAALAAAEAVAAKQDGLLRTYGAPSMEGVPTRSTPEPGERERDLTEAERLEIALKGRDDTRKRLLRETTPLFDTGAPAPTAWWTDAGPDDDLSAWSWKPSGGGWADADGTVPVVWTLVDDQGEARAVMRSSYDPVSRKFAAPTEPGQEQ